VAGRHPVCLPFDKQPRILLIEGEMKGIYMENLILKVSEKDTNLPTEMQIHFDYSTETIWFAITRGESLLGTFHVNGQDFCKIFEFIKTIKKESDRLTADSLVYAMFPDLERV
jgi:hypothetical protein